MDLDEEYPIFVAYIDFFDDSGYLEENSCILEAVFDDENEILGFDVFDDESE
jgi:hypothetical protein